LAKECDYSNDNKDSKNDVDKGKAKNCNNRSDNSSDIDNNNSRDSDSSDSDSSDSNKGNEAHRCIGRRELPAPISGGLKPKHAVKYYLQRSHLSPLIPFMHTSDWSIALSSNHYRQSGSPIYNRLCAQKPLLNSASNSDSSKVILGAALNNSEELLI
jgi:hypothetical protein